MLRALFIFLIISSFSFGQETDQQLAEYYYSEGQFDKALVYYEKLYDESENDFFFERYVNCLIETDELKKAEKELKRRADRSSGANEPYIQLAKFYERIGEDAKANSIYKELIENLPNSARSVIELYNAFKAQGKSDYSYQTLVRGRELLKKSYPLNFQFAEYYGAEGEVQKMMDEYLDLIDYHPTYKSSIQRVLSNQIDFTEEDSKEYEILKNALIERTQKKPNQEIYAEMLTWLFIQRGNFAGALVHVKALDKRTKSNGRQVYEFGRICIENKDYKTASKAFQYVVELGEESSYSVQAEFALLNVNFLEITTLRSFNQTEIEEAIVRYQTVLSKYGTNSKTLDLILELAEIEAYYGNKRENAISLLNDAKNLNGLTDYQRAEAKMLLADVYVLSGDIWEASLLYMQIDNDFKFEPIGHEAKFKNARIFYYDGEFNYAQSQLDVLKRSTTKLIANDAINLSLMITDNFGLDSNWIAMNWFAKGDLLIEQHQYDKGFAYFDSIMKEYPYHSLADEISMKKAHAMELQGRWNAAITYLNEITKYHKTDILADDAYFKLGDIYDNYLNDKEKAMECYRKVLFDYKGSLYSDEVRKRILNLRSSEDLSPKINP